MPYQTNIVAMKRSVLNMIAAERNGTYSYKWNMVELECEELALSVAESISDVCCNVCVC